MYGLILQPSEPHWLRLNCLLHLYNLYLVLSYIFYLFFIFSLWLSSSKVWWAFLWGLLWTLYQLNFLYLFKIFFLRFVLCLEHSFYFFIWLFFVDSNILDEIATSPSFEEVDLCRRWTISFNLALALGCLANICDHLSNLIYFNSWQ